MTQANFFKGKIDGYDQQFNELLEKAGAENIEEVTKKFLKEYENNFHEYSYINNLYQSFEDVQT